MKLLRTKSRIDLDECSRKDYHGELHFFSAQLTPFEHFNDASVLLVCTNITEQKLVQDHIVHMANHDGLTGLPNRTLLYDRLEQSLATCKA